MMEDEPSQKEETNKAELAASKEMSGNGQGNKAEPAESKEISGNGQGISKDTAAEAASIHSALLHDKDSELRTQTKSEEMEPADRSQFMGDNREMINASVIAKSNSPVAKTDSQTLAESFVMDACTKLSKDTAYENHPPPQPYTTDLDSDHKDDSDSDSVYEEGDSSGEEFGGLVQHDDSLSVKSSGNEKKRKRKQTANKAKREKKRERKREKHEQKKGNNSSSNVISSKIESLTIGQDKNIHNDIAKEDRIKHELMEPVLQSQNENTQENKGDYSRVPSDFSSNGKLVQTIHDPSQLSESAGNIEKGQKVFGTDSDIKRNVVDTAFEAKRPPSYSSLFDLGLKETKDAKNDKKGTSGESPHKNTSFNENAIEKNAKKTDSEQSSGMQTRSKTKNTDNYQKKNGQEGKVTIILKII